MDASLNRFRLLIDNAGVSRQKIADSIGCDVSTITKHYLGQRKINIDFLIKYAQYFHVSTDCLLDINPSRKEDAGRFDSIIYTGLSVQAVDRLHENINNLEDIKKICRIIEVMI